MIAALIVVAVAVVAGCALIVVTHRRQWYTRLRAQIRALPEHRREKEPV